MNPADELPPRHPPGLAVWLPNPDDHVHVRRLGWVVMVVLASGLLAFIARGADRPTDPFLGELVPDTAASLGAEASRVEGFDQVAFRIHPAEGETREFCSLLARTPEQQRQGLSRRNDLAGYDGMVFRFVEPTRTPFTMRDTLIPLSIAFFDEAGAFAAAIDMEPCPEGQPCTVYDAGVLFLHALEVELGALPGLGIGPGATLDVGGPCPP